VLNKLLYYNNKGVKMFDYGSGNINEIIGAMYNYYEVQCIAEAFDPIDKVLFEKTIVDSYNYYLDHVDVFLSEEKILRVVLNWKNDKPFFCVDIEGGEEEKDSNIEITLIIEPEV
jgi:hypothetical protein